MRPPLARPLLQAAASACDHRWHARPPLARPLLHAAASTCDRHLMQLPSSLDRLAVDSIVDAADLYAHSQATGDMVEPTRWADQPATPLTAGSWRHGRANTTGRPATSAPDSMSRA
ncbi:hypothetical protein GW17_00054520 [Ensete ventricosum]|nr:hypothetical protein GW17_00054520 [Ensete ventricosum]